MHERDEERAFIHEHANGYPIIKTTVFEKWEDHNVFQANVNKSFTQRFQGRGIGNLLLDMGQEEGH